MKILKHTGKLCSILFTVAQRGLLAHGQSRPRQPLRPQKTLTCKELIGQTISKFIITRFYLFSHFIISFSLFQILRPLKILSPDGRPSTAQYVTDSIRNISSCAISNTTHLIQTELENDNNNKNRTGRKIPPSSDSNTVFINTSNQIVYELHYRLLQSIDDGR